MSQSPSSEEILQVFDADGNPTHGLPRSVVKSEPRIFWCAVVNIWLINEEGKIACSKRSMEVKGNPGKWQTYFGGHLKENQSYIEAVIAEMKEEVGLKIEEDRLFFVSKTSDERYLTHAENYIYLLDGDDCLINFVDGEVVEMKWMTLDEYQKEQEKNPEQWCNGINEKNKPIIRAWIAANTKA